MSEITFYDAHYPVLEDGDYTFTFEQTLNPALANAAIPTNSVEFHVNGPRFAINSNHIVSTFPPNAGKGDFMAVLPTLVLDRSTIPWERSPLTEPNDDSVVKNSSWLFLLLVDESEMDQITEQSQTVLASKSPQPDAKKDNLEDLILNKIATSLQVEKDDVSILPASINYLEVPTSLVSYSSSSIIPQTLSELQYLSYARIKDSGEEHAVLLGNRLPKKGSNSIVYLISLENCYDNTFTFQGITSPNDSKTKIFPYLYKWKFHALDDELFCITEDKQTKINTKLSTSFDFTTIFSQVFTTKEDFEAKLKTSPFNVPTTNFSDIEDICKVPGSNFHELLSNLNGGFEPLANPVQSNPITNSGSVNLNYLNGSESSGTKTKITAYYRSPLAASPIDLSPLTKLSFASGNFPVQASDLEIIFNGEKDLTYSSAFELGRLTALDDVDFANEFYKWKSEYAVATRVTSDTNVLSHLAVSDVNTIPEMPKHIKDKFIAWKQLKGIPYRYLVPDPSLLPNESIRFFQVDQNWIKAFICGAFSIGHTIETDFTDELNSLMSFEPIQETIDKKNMEINFPAYGFLINSFAVSGWPGYEVDASNVEYTKNNIQDKSSLIAPPTRSKLDTNIELFLYTEQFKGLNFHLHPGKTHSGFLYENGSFTKESETITATISPTLTGDGENGPYVVDIKTLLNDIETKYNSSKLATDPDYSISVFAGKMLEGTPEVLFNIGASST